MLTGGERAQLCLAVLLLSQYNVLILDEPGNHLDVDTVEALAEALCNYQGTVIFTSHDRHFMKRVATCVIEVRDGHVTNYRGDYDAYVYSVNKEIDEGEREQAARRAKAPPAPVAGKPAKSAPVLSGKSERELRKELTNLERTVAKLDGERRKLNDQLLNTSDAKEALRLHNEAAEITNQLAAAEDRWLELQSELGEME